MTCATCTGRDVLGTTAHYGWCDVVGGPGYAPNSLRGMQAEVRRRQEELARAAAEEAARQKSNNGWVKYKGDERSYEHLHAVPSIREEFEAQLEHTVQRFERDATPVAKTTEAGVITRPGRELPKYWRQIATYLIDQQGWSYRYKRKGGSHPRIVPPDGGLGVSLPTTVTEGHAGHRASYLSALKRAGALLDGVA
jgi:hypothetical protein